MRLATLPTIGFRFLSPRLPICHEILGNRFLERHPVWMRRVQRWNTKVHLTEAEHGALAVTDTIPRMSTRAIGAILLHLVGNMPDGSAYVNVGLWHGFSFLCPATGYPDRRCVGVDNFSQFGSPRAAFLEKWDASHSQNHAFYDHDYEEYFRTYHEGPIGAYFFDGPHSYNHQRRGLELAEPFFVPGTTIVVDDTNWPHPRRATEDFVRDSKHSYVQLLDVRTAGNCHPTFWNGIIVLQRL